MMDQMVRERGGTVCAMDHRYCIDNGAMVSYCYSPYGLTLVIALSKHVFADMSGGHICIAIRSIDVPSR